MLYDQLQESKRFLQHQTDNFNASIGIILGTGLGNFANEIDIDFAIPYEEIPHFPISTVEGHAGRLIFGKIEGKNVIALSGRFHFYEGYSMKQVTFPVRVIKLLGVKTMLISNAAGSTNATIQTGDLVFIKDHINLQPENPLRGANDERLGPRFPDLLHAYSKILNKSALNIANEAGIRASEGVYVALQGPNLETPAEYDYLHRIGGDVVGMSTVPEVLVAKHMGMTVFVTSVVSNACYPISTITETTLDEVIKVMKSAEPKLTLIFKALIKSL